MSMLRIVVSVAVGFLLLGAAVPVSGFGWGTGSAAVWTIPALPAAVLPPLALLVTLALIRRARRRDEQRLI